MRSLPRAGAIGAAAATVVAVAVSGCQSSAGATDQPSGHLSASDQPSEHSSASDLPPIGGLAAQPAPARWRHAGLPDGGAVLAYPPDMHSVSGDRGSLSVAKLSSSGGFLMYLNATPRQGDETLAGWPDMRVEHLTDDDASSARPLAESFHVHFSGGTGSCVLDRYVTKVKSHHFTEIACFVQGRTSASVIVAAAPTARWAVTAPVLERAIAAYQVG
jgi:hypothetical protein